MKYHEIKKIARDLRKQQTPAEKLLWSFSCFVQCMTHFSDFHF